MFETDKSYHLVLEYFKDGDLFDNLMKTERYTLRALKKAILQLLEGVAVLHKRGLVHRDLKSKNVLVELGQKDFTIKLADFGLVKKVNDSDKVMNNVCGTPGYMAPEMIREEGYD